MKLIKITLLFTAILSLTNCASKYNLIKPETINYLSSHEENNLKLEYKYNLLDKKYAKKESKRGVKLVAIKITNKTNNDLTIGHDAVLTYANGTEINVMDNETVFKTLKQSPATYLLYLLLTPFNLYVTRTDSNNVSETSSTPIGLILGPGIAGANMIVASSANKKFKTEMLDYNIHGTVIKKGDTKTGLIGIRAESFDSLKLKIK